MNIVKALSSLRPTSKYIVKNDIIEWLDTEQTQPTAAELDTEVKRLQAEYDAKEYARNREVEYPPMADQLDYIFHNGVDKWKEDIVQPVKDKYPKPE